LASEEVIEQRSLLSRRRHGGVRRRCPHLPRSHRAAL